MKTLRPHRHTQLEFFIADDIEVCTFRDEIASMEHPFFALKGNDTKIREYKNGNITVKVRSAAGIGLATIFDKDIWIYAISKLQEAINNNQPISRIVTFTPYDFFVTTNRDKGGKSYKELEKSLARLQGTVIQTNIFFYEEKQETIGFGLIDSWRIVEKKKGRLDIGMVEITLTDWLYQAITKTKVLKINPDYFRIRKAIDRRMYEIARKHCGSQYEFVIKLEKLHLKTGSSSTLKEFKRKLKSLILSNDLPDYMISYNEKTDNIIFTNRDITAETVQSFQKIKKINKNQKIKKKLNNIQKKITQNKKIISKNIDKTPIHYIKIPEGFRG